MYENAIYNCISWYWKICWFPVRNADTYIMSRDSYIFSISFYYYRICVADYRKGSFLPPASTSRNSPEKAYLNRVKTSLKKLEFRLALSLLIFSYFHESKWFLELTKILCTALVLLPTQFILFRSFI